MFGFQRIWMIGYDGDEEKSFTGGLFTAGPLGYIRNLLLRLSTTVNIPPLPLYLSSTRKVRIDTHVPTPT